MKDKKLQYATQFMIERYSAWYTHMLTLHLLDTKECTYIKSGGWSKGAIQRTSSELTDDAAKSSLRYFIEVLNYKLHGRKTRKKRYKDKCRILAIPVFEGAKNNKRRHFHILLGNVPQDKLVDLEKTIADCWADTKWSMAGIKLEEIYNADGAAFYLRKEVGYCNDDAVLWEFASIPNRLIGKSA